MTQFSVTLRHGFKKKKSKTLGGGLYSEKKFKIDTVKSIDFRSPPKFLGSHQETLYLLCSSQEAMAQSKGMFQNYNAHL